MFDDNTQVVDSQVRDWKVWILAWKKKLSEIRSLTKRRLKEKLNLNNVSIQMDHMVAMARENDPWNITEADIRNAEWFAEKWNKHVSGQRERLHLRGFHYLLVSKNELKPDGTVYRNTNRDWNYLTRASKFARYLHLIDPKELVDQKNTTEVYYEPPNIKVDGKVIAGEISLPYFNPEFSFSLPEYRQLSLEKFESKIWQLQPVYVEVWIEKSTMNYLIQPICEKYHINLVYGEGFGSITKAVEFLENVKRSAKRTGVVLYISDFDPAGDFMPLAISRQLQFWNQEYGLDLRLVKIALTAEQVKKYDLPFIDIKDSDHRKKRFCEKYDVPGAVELDALEAHYPGELGKILESEIRQLFDENYLEKLKQAIDEYNLQLERYEDLVLSRYQNEIEELTEQIEEAKEKYLTQIEELYDRMMEELAPVAEQLEELNEKIADELDELTPPFELPQPDQKEREYWLYDSRRSYFEQLIEYKRGNRFDELIAKTAKEINEELKAKN